jgi:pantothenate kinase
MSLKNRDSTFTVTAAGFSNTITIPKAEIETVHRPVIERVARLADGHPRPVVLLAGPSGTGKTTLAALWRLLADDMDAGPEWTVLSLDGFHLPHSTLLERTLTRDGRTVPLVRIKGAPETFDLGLLTNKLGTLANGAELRWPEYDRNLHDPVADAIAVPDRGVVIVEGLYMLLDQPGWRELRGLAHLGIFVEAPDDLTRARVLARHQRGGRTEADAEAHWLRSDAVNTQLVNENRHGIDMLLSADSCGRLRLG